MFRRLFGREKSKDKLKDRLKLVLAYDRANLSPRQMENFRDDLLGVIKRYFPSEGDYDVKLEQHGDKMVLVANIPMNQ
ncbi:cell division topological specificity factor MinE [soil metagenome]|jgi:cell division topological specificity factor|nr:cell division topological specificity factor MinE [Deinococcota bacterium]